MRVLIKVPVLIAILFITHGSGNVCIISSIGCVSTSFLYHAITPSIRVWSRSSVCDSARDSATTTDGSWLKTSIEDVRTAADSSIATSWDTQATSPTP